MNKDIFKKINDDLSLIRMTDKEKRDSWILVEKETQKYPVRVAALVGHQWGLANFYRFATTPKYSLAICLVIVLLLTGSLSIAAQNSLPGSSLYGVKLGTENMNGIFKVSENAKVEWQATLASRRLEEAEILAIDNRLEGDMAVKLEADFEKHSKNVESGIMALSNKDARAAANISSDFEASLKIHRNKLSKISVKGDSNDNNNSKEKNRLIMKVDDKSKITSDQRTKAEARLKNKAKQDDVKPKIESRDKSKSRRDLEKNRK